MVRKNVQLNGLYFNPFIKGYFALAVFPHLWRQCFKVYAVIQDEVTHGIILPFRLLHRLDHMSQCHILIAE